MPNHQLKGLHVEFIGPPCAGKSTFCDKLFSDKLDRNKWNLRRSSKQFMMSRQDPWFKYLDHSDFYTQLIHLKYEELKDTPIPESYRQMSFNFVLTELALESFVQKEILPVGSFLSDDGLTHTFTSQLLKLDSMSQYDRELNHLFKRKFIYFDASLENVMANLKRRHQHHKGEGSDALTYFTEDEIKVRMSNLISNYQKILEMIDQRGGKVLKINYTDSFHLNSEKIINFLKIGS